jgi:hypothetical protein
MTASDITSLGRVILATPGVVLRSASTQILTNTPSGGGVDGGSGNANGGPSGLSDVTLLAGPGQSNAGYAETQDGAFTLLAQAVAFYLQAAGSYATLSAWVNAGWAGTEVSGTGVMEIVTPALYGESFLSNSAGTDFSAATAANAALGACGTGYASYVAGLSGMQLGRINALVCYWGETDSLEYGPADKAVYAAALTNLVAQVRGMLGKTAAEMPVIFFGPPYGLLPNYITYPPTLREVWAEMDADPALNFNWAVRQTYDTISRNESWAASTGIASGGNTDGGHRSATDNVMLFKRAALPTARAILAANGLSAALIPASLGSGLGPRIVDAALSGVTLTLTIAHDGGTDLIVPLLASQGVGFSVMDGGSIASPGPIIQATSCTRVDATHLSLTLASALANANASCRLLYPWAGEYWAVQPDAEIGRGCAVTDNFATIVKPNNFDINTSLGVGWGANMPLQIPVTVTSGVASYGIPLSS